ncbi:hypothetical protein KDH_70250 [Dictyobacter sp. S3.2.2.5]|uniref:Uncharacterized protein n=1 Tax=Dictyobacter halimunensis TaxID=3026934 RepID=A0ABQ6G102_9CHLR|nr:hypothetical protein KDH_70250 [Dictyobacter sp. S3.2.2.5]
MKPEAQYIIRYWFEWAAECFWSVNDAARERFGYAIIPEALPLSAQTIELVNELISWHDHALNWEYPPDPGPWRQEECDRFNQAARNLLATIRQELGEQFEVIDDFVEEVEDPELDAYLQDPQGFVRQKQID